jgi:hypothetical protein
LPGAEPFFTDIGNLLGIGVHKLDKFINGSDMAKRSAANLIWTKPCGNDTLKQMQVTAKPSNLSAGYISGENGMMVIQSRYSFFHTEAEAMAAAKAKFLCCKK